MIDLISFEAKRWSTEWRNFTVGRRLKFAAAVAFLLVTLPLASYGWFQQPTLAWLALFGILFAAPGIGMRAMAREWKEETLYWWLTLPVPRRKLLAAKWLACLKRWWLMWTLVFIYVAVYIAEVNLVRDWSLAGYLAQLQIGLWQLGAAIVLSPFLTMFGLWIGVFNRKENRYIIAVMWIGLVTIANVHAGLVSPLITFSLKEGAVDASRASGLLAVEAVFAYLAAWFMFTGLARYLENKRLY